jgi:hypothetical protein
MPLGNHLLPRKCHFSLNDEVNTINWITLLIDRLAVFILYGYEGALNPSQELLSEAAHLRLLNKELKYLGVSHQLFKFVI